VRRQESGYSTRSPIQSSPRPIPLCSQQPCRDTILRAEKRIDGQSAITVLLLQPPDDINDSLPPDSPVGLCFRDAGHARRDRLTADITGKANGRDWPDDTIRSRVSTCLHLHHTDPADPERGDCYGDGRSNGGEAVKALNPNGRRERDVAKQQANQAAVRT